MLRLMAKNINQVLYFIAIIVVHRYR